MKIVLIILSIIGLLKLVSLFILCVIKVVYYLKKDEIVEIQKSYYIYKVLEFYIIPTIRISKYNKFFDVEFIWFNVQYYSSYTLIREEDEK